MRSPADTRLLAYEEEVAVLERPLFCRAHDIELPGLCGPDLVPNGKPLPVEARYSGRGDDASPLRANMEQRLNL